MNTLITVVLVVGLIGLSALLPWAFKTIAAAWRKWRSRQLSRHFDTAVAIARAGRDPSRSIDLEVAEFAAQISAWNQNGGRL